MTQATTVRSAALKAEKRTTGLLYGLLAGLGFTLAAWGYDTYLLANSHALLPWGKLAIGGVVALVVFGLAGWLTALTDRALVGLVTWLAAGVVMAWFSAHLPYENFYPAALKLFYPELQSQLTYPFTETAGARLVSILWTFFIASPIAGLLELPLIDSAMNAIAVLGRLFPLSLVLFIYIFVGISVDNLANELLRSPIVALDQLITFAIQNQGVTLDSKTIRETHIRALDTVPEVVTPERTLIVSSYDPSLVMVNVLVNAQGKQAICIVVDSQVSTCAPGSQGASAAPAGAASARKAQPAPADTPAPTTASTPPAQALENSEAAPASRTPSPEKTILHTEAPTAAAVPLLPAAQASLPDLSAAPRYTMTLNIAYAEHTFSGQQQVLYTNAEDTSLDNLYFHLIPNGHSSYGNGSLTVSEVTLDGQPAQTQLSGGDTLLEVKLPAALAPGEQASLGLQFTGQVPVDFGGDATPDGYGIFNISEDVMALADWYPILAVYDQEGWHLDGVSSMGDSVYSDIAFYSVHVTAPPEVKVAATGVETSEGENGERNFSSGPARDFFLALSPKFQIASQRVDGTTINSYYLPEHSSGGQIALSTAASSLETYNQYIGPYPYSEFDVVEAPMRNASGVEFPGIVLIGSFLYPDAYQPSFLVTVAHEVAHQWWYNLVGNNPFENPWMDEALATYTSSLYYEGRGEMGGVTGLRKYWEDRYQKIQDEGGDDAITQSLAHFEQLGDPRPYSAVVYSKGALFFYALRQETGDQAFFKGLQSYYQEFQYRIATPENLLNVFEQASGRQLDEFYQKWLAPPP